MTEITASQLRAIMPASGAHADIYAEPLSNAMTLFGIVTPACVAAFIAQIAEESGSLDFVVENLDYSAGSLLAMFGRYFDAERANEYGRKPERIANRIYALRLGNGDEASGDGWAYRGRGLIQITGRYTYDKCGAGIGLNLIAKPDLLATPGPAAQSAAWYWHSRNLNALAEAGDFRGVTRGVNGYGMLHEAEREAFWHTARAVLGA